MKIRKIKPENLIPYENNPRTITQEAIEETKKSIENTGGALQQPIVVDKNMVIVVGHTRQLAAIALGLKTVPVHVADYLTAKQLKAYRIADNKTGEIAEWDFDKLKVEFTELEEFNVDLDLTSFSEPEIAEIMIEDSAGETPPVEKVPCSFTLYSQENIEDEAFKHYRAAGFPYRDLSIHECMQELNKLYDLPKEKLLKSNLCYQVCDTFNKHRMQAHSINMMSPVDAFNVDKKLRKAIHMQIEEKGLLTTGALNKISVVSGTQACSNFRPAFAKYIYDEYAPDGARVLDTSTGYGGRLLGYAASLNCSEYFGIDPNKETCAANTIMIQELNIEGAVIINLPAEDVGDKNMIDEESCDFAFTSPPYFKKEIYSNDATQSCNRYPNEDDWRHGFLIPMLKLQFECLKSGSINAVNIADVKIGSKTTPLEEWIIEDAKEVGFIHTETLKFKMSSRMGANQEDDVATEPVFIFRKP